METQIPLGVVQLQMDKFAQQIMDLEDADFAYQLQMQEALKASAPANDIDCTALNGSFRDDAALTNNQLQTAVLRQAADVLTDAEQARKLQQDIQQPASLEAHDLRVAR
ncbi:hypothetical protein WJX82_001817 [Trebouxia sp. C0006]